jgi:hypothetical protein
MDPTRTLDTGIASGLVTVLVDELGGGSSSIQTPAADFEAAERGVAIGRRFIPWHRVRRYEWDLPPKEFGEEHRVSATVRLVVDDANGMPEEHVVSADGFEASASAVTMLLEDAGSGTVTVRRVGIPWHHVREYERIPADAAPGDAPSAPTPEAGHDGGIVPGPSFRR